MCVRLVAVLGCLAFHAAAWGQTPQSIAGVVQSVTGEAVVHRGSQSIPAAAGMHLFEKDTVRTSANSRAGLILQDGSRLALDPETSLTITHFLYEPGQQKMGLVLDLLRGAAAYISGKISKLAPKSVEIKTPVGMLGLRGTEVIVSLELP